MASIRKNPLMSYGMAEGFTPRIEGEIREFTGVSAPYEPPGSPYMTVDTSIGDPAECTRKVLCGIINSIGISASVK